MEVARLDAALQQIVRQVLGHLLRQGGDEDPLADLLAPPDLVQQVVDLVLGRAQLDLGVDEVGRPDQLLGDLRGMPQLERPRGGRDEDQLRHLLEELVEAERAVVERRREPEAVVDERLLARAVALVHPADLRHCLVRLVDEDDEVLLEVIEQRERMGARPTALEDARVVLDPVAEAELLHHLEVVFGALPDAMRLEHPSLSLEVLDLLLELVPDLLDRALDCRLGRDVLRRGPDREVVEPREDLPRDRVEVGDLLHLVAEEGDPVGRLLVRGLHLDDVALDAEAATPEHRVVAHVLRVDQLPQDEVAVVLGAHLEVGHPVAPLLRRSQAVDAGHRRDDDHVAPGEERRSRGEPEPRDVVVLGRVLLDVEVGLRDVCLGLVVVVVGDEVLDGVVWEELAELVAELGGQRLVVRDDQRGLLNLLDDPGHRGRLAGAGRAEERLVALAREEPCGELLDRTRLVAGGRVVG